MGLCSTHLYSSPYAIKITSGLPNFFTKSKTQVLNVATSLRRNGDPSSIPGSLQTFKRCCLSIAQMLFLFLTIKLGKEKAGENLMWLRVGQSCLLCGEVSPGMLRVRQVTLSLPLVPAGLAQVSQWPQSSQRLRPAHVCLHREIRDWCNRLDGTGTGWEVWVLSILWGRGLGECSCWCLPSATSANQCSEKARCLPV